MREKYPQKNEDNEHEKLADEQIYAGRERWHELRDTKANKASSPKKTSKRSDRQPIRLKIETEEETFDQSKPQYWDRVWQLHNLNTFETFKKIFEQALAIARTWDKPEIDCPNLFKYGFYDNINFWSNVHSAAPELLDKYDPVISIRTKKFLQEREKITKKIQKIAHQKKSASLPQEKSGQLLIPQLGDK